MPALRVPPRPAAIYGSAAVAVLLLFTLAACSGTSGPSLTGGGTRSVPIPNAVAGGTRRSAQDEARAAAAATADMSREELQALATQRLAKAQALWNRAQSIEQRNPADAADLYADVVDDYPEFEQAAEARYREGRNRFRAHEYNDAVRALRDYMQIAPVNPHLADVEEMIFEAGSRYLRRDQGILGIFTSDDFGLKALEYVAETFPAGTYADDALYLLGEYYRKDEDYAAAALHHKELLIRYPDSEWSFKARLRLADTYFARDQGERYHAGFVDIDPRESTGGAEDVMGGPVRSAMTMALEQYEIYLERMQMDPGRVAEYRADVEHARQRRRQCRENLAAKDLFVANWLAGRGEREASRVYLQSAAQWSDTQAGRTAARRLGTMAAPAVRTPAPRRAPAVTTVPTRPPMARPAPATGVPTTTRPATSVPPRPPPPPAPPPLRAYGR